MRCLDGRRGDLTTFLVKRQHHGHTITQRQIIPGEVKPFPAFVRPDRTNARPDLLPVLVFASVPAVVEDICWGVWHRNID